MRCPGGRMGDAARTEADRLTEWKLRAINDRRVARAIAVLLGQLPMRALPVDRSPLVGDSPEDRPIPRIVWSTWRDNRFGRAHARGIEAFRERNPNHEFRIVSHEERDAFVMERFSDHPVAEIFEKANFQPMKADIWRYLVLLTYGGWYFDIKSCLRVSLDSLARPDIEAVVTYEKMQDKRLRNGPTHPDVLHPGHRLVNWGFAARPGHPILHHVIAGIVERAPQYVGRTVKDPKGAIIDLTGPTMFARALYATAKEHGLAGVLQHGFEFDDAGIYEMRYSWVRFLTAPSYAQARDQPIITSR